MTDRTTTLEEAVEQHDVTLALSPGQAILAIIGVVVLLRVIRRLLS